MSRQEELAAAIRDAVRRVRGTFGMLNDAQLATPIASRSGAWTAGEVLAHLAGRERTYDLLFELAERGALPSGFDVDAWNRERLAEQAGRSRPELVEEVAAVHERLIARIAQLSEAELARPVPSREGTVPFAILLERSAVRHTIEHCREVERALGLNPPRTVG